MNSGALNERLKKLVKLGSKHVKQCVVSKKVIASSCGEPNPLPDKLDE